MTDGDAKTWRWDDLHMLQTTSIEVIFSLLLEQRPKGRLDQKISSCWLMKSADKYEKINVT